MCGCAARCTRSGGCDVVSEHEPECPVLSPLAADGWDCCCTAIRAACKGAHRNEFRDDGDPGGQIRTVSGTHLPECSLREDGWRFAFYSGGECICYALLCCEVRVRDGIRQPGRVTELIREARADALDQVLGAVRTAVDGLRGESHG